MTTHGLDFLADQRYYHFVLFRTSREFKLSEYWRQLGDVEVPRRPVDFVGSSIEIQHRKFRSDKAFARGAIAEGLSLKGGGRPPYLYDVIAAKMTASGESYCALGFPFVSLGLQVIRGLFDGGKFVKSSEVVGVDIPKLIGLAEKGIEDFRQLHSQVVGVQFVVTDDKSLTAVRLGGDSPLSAQIYLNFLRTRVRAGFCLPDKCVLSCARESEEGHAHRTVRTRLHLTGYGHFKLYAHSGLSNVQLISFAVGQLRMTGCLQKVLGNPLLRAGQEDAE